jgi:transcriptional regulator with XRE-family HTH domain
MATFNLPLKNAIFASGKPQRYIARKANIYETRMSEIVRGRVVPTKEERKRIARALDAPVGQLFPSFSDEAVA